MTSDLLLLRIAVPLVGIFYIAMLFWTKYQKYREDEWWGEELTRLKRHGPKEEYEERLAVYKQQHGGKR